MTEKKNQSLFDFPPLFGEDDGLVPLLDGFYKFDELPSLEDCLADINIDLLTWDENLSPCCKDLDDEPLPPSSVASANGGANGLVVWRDEGKIMKDKITSTSRSKLSHIGFEEIRSYFYMPITKAAKEMNVGLTVLKKRCRELGIQRWPHRKMNSLKSLIHNVKELGKGESEEIIRSELRILEEQKKLMEANPEIELNERTKKLRQACFKASYKKRRAMRLPCLYEENKFFFS